MIKSYQLNLIIKIYNRFISLIDKILILYYCIMNKEINLYIQMYSLYKIKKNNNITFYKNNIRF